MKTAKSPGYTRHNFKGGISEMFLAESGPQQKLPETPGLYQHLLLLHLSTYTWAMGWDPEHATQWTAESR